MTEVLPLAKGRIQDNKRWSGLGQLVVKARRQDGCWWSRDDFLFGWG